MQQNDLAMRIKLIRNQRNWSQAEFAEFADISQSVISRVESGKTTTVLNLYNIAKGLGVSMEYLIDGKEPTRQLGTSEKKTTLDLSSELREEARFNHEILLRETQKILRKVEKIEDILAKGLSDDR